MGVLERIYKALERRYHVSQEPPGWITDVYGMETYAGTPVNTESALQMTAVLACVRVLAESVASLPLILYRRLDNGGKERAGDHYLYPVLHDQANPEMSAYTFWETLIGNAALTGNGYAQIVTDRGGRVRELWPLDPNRMSVSREGGRRVYTYTLTKPDEDGNLKRVFGAGQVLHVPGLGFDGMVGYSPIALARQAIGMGLAAEEYAARFFANGAEPGVVLHHPGKLSQEAHTRLRTSFDQAHAGKANRRKTVLLEEGMTLSTVSVSPEDAQFLEQRKFQVAEIARLFRVPPHMIGDLDRATFSNIEQQSLEFVRNTLAPWLRRAEQAIWMRLITPSDQAVYFAQFLVEGMLRGDTTSRYQAYAIARQNGWMSANEIRELENLNPVDGGNVYLVPLNMVAAGETDLQDGQDEEEDVRGGETPSPALPHPESTDGGGGRARWVERAWANGSVEERASRAAISRHRLKNGYRRLYRDTAQRILRREVNDIRAAAQRMLAGQRDAQSFTAWLEQYYREAAYIGRAMGPISQTYADLVEIETEKELGRNVTDDTGPFVRSYVDTYQKRHAGLSMKKIEGVLARATAAGDDPFEALDGELETWEDERGEEIGQEESVRANNAFAHAIYAAAGVTLIRSMAFGDSCPYCDDLDGRVVAIDRPYIAAGDAYQPEGAEGPLVSSVDLGHAPYHRGCDCMNVAGN